MATLLAIRGPLTGARIPLTNDLIQIGRATSSDITIADATVSRTHSILRRQGLAWMIEDCESSSGTAVNGIPLKAPRALSPNDEIKIGHSLFLFDSEFDVQNADFTDNSVYMGGGQDDTVAIEPIATLDPQRIPESDLPARQGMELLSELGDLFDSSKVPFGEALRASLQRMARILKSDVAILMMYNSGTSSLRPSAVIAKGDVFADGQLMQRIFSEKKALLISDKPDFLHHPAPNAPTRPRVRSVVAAPLMVENTALGVLYFERQELDAYTLKDLRLVQSLGRLMAVFIEARQRTEALLLKTRFHSNESGMVGGSPTFRKTIEMVRRVSDTPATVLLIGETGTGKEVIANEIHRLSERSRQGKPFVAVNCAAIPESLFESELFGHEKGSFTGAHRMRQGLIEQAEGGTLFLDEIGEMAIHVQPKLLRFLQEKTFVRVGGSRVLRADVRVISATNRNLLNEVAERRFREDLYHRISVMPIEIPPLRDRKEDIRLLAEHFALVYGRNLRKNIVGISDEAIMALEKHDWPGNVRELANSMERAILFCDEKILLPRHFLLATRKVTPANDSRAEIAKVKFDAVPDAEPAPRPTPVKVDLRPLDAVEKEHILQVLRHLHNNQIRTAEVLGIHRNTLRKKLTEWGITGDSEW